MNIESICADLLDPGSDFVVPFIKLDKKQKTVQLKGLALFHGDRYTGEYLTPEESTLFLLIKGEKGKTARQTFKVFNNQHTELENYVNVNVQKASPKLKIKISPAGEVNATYDVKLSVAVEEYPHDRLANQKQRQLLTKRLDAVFTKRAEKMIEKLQRNNCDAFGLGTRLNAFHHDYWLKSDWNEDYKKVKINVNIKTVLLQQGAIN